MSEAKSKLRRKMSKVKEDFSWLKISLKEQAAAIGLGTNEVKLLKLYRGEVYDGQLIEKLVALRDGEMRKVNELAETI